MFNSSAIQTTKKSVLIIGSSFGGLVAAQTLGSKFNINVVDRKSYFEYTPSFHYALQQENYINKITADLQSYANKKKFNFVFGNTVKLNSNSAVIQRFDGQDENIPFDYCIIATGSNYPSLIKQGDKATTLQERRQQMKDLINKLNNSKNMLVVGGGPVGVEVAGVCKDHFKHLDVDVWLLEKELLKGYPKKARQLAYNSLVKLGVNIQFEKKVSKLPQDQFDYIFDCRGNIYQPEFLKNKEFEQYLDKKGRIQVDDYERLENHKHIYCIGDACISPNDEAKMSYNASIQGQFAAQNIMKTENNDKNLKKQLSLNKSLLEGSPNIFNVTTGTKNAIFCFGERFAYESSMVHHFKMMLQWISVQTYKGSYIANTLGYIQRQEMIGLSHAFNLFQNKKIIT